jgi:hypothetical protein
MKSENQGQITNYRKIMKGQIENPNKNTYTKIPGNPNKKKFLFGLSTQNLKNIGNPNKKSRKSKQKI